MASTRPRCTAERWKPRILSAMSVRLLAITVPIASSVGAAVAIVSALPPAPTRVMLVTHGALVVVPATATLWVVDRLARRFLPLATLLRLSLAFPDQAPSRYAVARLTGSTRELRRRIDEARARGVSDDPSEAAKMILALVTALSLHDRRTRGHSERVRLYTDLLAEELRLTPDERDRLRWSALVHDIGKLHVPAKVLNKAGAPTEHEWDVLRSHPEEGERLCAALLPWLGEPGRAIVEHHERFDGQGYPRGLRGREISLYGRILAVADAFEVMTAARAYKRPMDAAAARAELSRCAGSQFDPGVVRAFLGVSLGRLRLAMGPLSWLAQWPVLSHLPRLGPAAGQVGGTVAGAAALTTSGWLAPAAPEALPRARSAAAHAEAVATSWMPAGPEDVVPPRAEPDEGAIYHRLTRSAGEDPEQGRDPLDADEQTARSEAPGDESEDEPPPASNEDDGSGPVGDLTNELTDAVDDTTDALTDTVDDTTDALTDTVDEILEPVPDTVSDVTDDGTHTVDAASEGVTDASDDASDSVTDAVDGVVDSLTVLGGLR